MEFTQLRCHMGFTEPNKQFSFHHSRLGRFRRLRYLNLGEGIGNGWLEQGFLDHFYLSSGGIGRLDNLVVFRMNYDCTDRVLDSVLENSGKQLRVVDVRNSQYVTDAGEGFC